MLTHLILWPLIAAGVVLVLPGNYRFLIRLAALAGTGISLVIATVVFFQFDPQVAGFQFVQKAAWVEALGIAYHVGVDGLNVALVFMAAVVAFAATAVSWEIRERVKEFYLLLLVMVAGVLGTFASLDMFFFFFFHELALIPTFIMIGVWGRGENKNYATFKMTLYLSLGALISLVGLVVLYVAGGSTTFDMVQMTERLRQNPLDLPTQHFIFPFLLIGFGILISLWPFHTWAPMGYTAAPTATAMLHAGVLKKFGLYGLIRIALPMLPDAAASWAHVIACLCLGNVVYCGFVAMRQRDLNMLIGNSSVAHMGFVFLGIASLTWLGITGAIVVMVAHGFLAALSFGLTGYLRQQTGTLQMGELGGLLKAAPFLGTVVMMAMFAGCGLPGFANFPGEMAVFFAAWERFPAIVAIAVWGALVIGAVYMLRAIREIWHGELPERWARLRDLGERMREDDSRVLRLFGSLGTAWRRAPYLLLLLCLIVFGLAPRLLTDRIKGAAERIVQPPVVIVNTDAVRLAEVAGKDAPILNVTK